ncbi:hypothetical protein PQX77_018457 [Marasmius sp. AFHP31]|nr:hypothetical protein PQX77_018457 [Marasmius sp. AFHP31]
MANLSIERFVLDPRPAYPLRITAKRYSLVDNTLQNRVRSDAPGLTLVFLHATGSHKEAWEVTIQTLLQKASQTVVKIDDVFSIESPGHGSPLFRTRKNSTTYFLTTGPRQYAKAAHLFLTAGVSAGAGVDFSAYRSRRNRTQRRSICNASPMKELTPIVNFELFIAVEPGISPKGNHHTNVTSRALTGWTWLRPDVWISKKAAKKA